MQALPGSVHVHWPEIGCVTEGGATAGSAAMASMATTKMAVIASSRPNQKNEEPVFLALSKSVPPCVWTGVFSGLFDAFIQSLSASAFLTKPLAPETVSTARLVPIFI